MVCWKCKKEIKVEGIYRTTECPLCGCDLHSCRQCRFYSPGNHYDCKESIDVQVSDKERSNFCDFFAPDEKKDFGSSENSLKKDDSRSARDLFDSLFK